MATGPSPRNVRVCGKGGTSFRRAGRIRTDDPLTPSQVRYRAALLPEGKKSHSCAFDGRGALGAGSREALSSDAPLCKGKIRPRSADVCTSGKHRRVSQTTIGFEAPSMLIETPVT